MRESRKGRRNLQEIEMTTKSTSTQYSLTELAYSASLYAGDFAADFDLDAVAASHLAAINEQLPEGAYIAANGEMFYEAGMDIVDIDLKDIADSVDLDAIMQANEV